MNKQQLSGIVSALVVRDEDFERGLYQGRQSYEEEYEGETLTDGDVAKFIETNLCRKMHERQNRVLRVLYNEPPVPYNYYVGFVVGWLLALMATPLTEVPAFSTMVL